MTKRETLQKKAAITKQRAINIIPKLTEFKKHADWETIARNFYEILASAACKSQSGVLEELEKLISKKEKTPPKGQKSSVVMGSIKHIWAPYCISIKRNLKIKSNIEAARIAIKDMKLMSQLNAESEEKLIKNLSKRMSEIEKNPERNKKIGS